MIGQIRTFLPDIPAARQPSEAQLAEDFVHFTEVGPQRIDPSNSHLAQQIETANAALRSMSCEGITVTDIRLGGAEPLLRVTMPPSACCLPGTAYVRRRGEHGMEVLRRAYAYGCRIEWEVQ